MKRFGRDIYRLATIGVALAALITTVVLGTPTASAQQCPLGVDPVSGTMAYGPCPGMNGSQSTVPASQWGPGTCSYTNSGTYYFPGLPNNGVNYPFSDQTFCFPC